MATVLPLPRLSLSSVTELVRSVGALRSEDMSERLYRETEGLPFFLVEYLAMLAQGNADKTLALGDWSLPGGARDLLHSRLALVSETGGQLLSTAAVIGRSFDFETLREASGRGDEETVAALEGLVSQGLVKEVRAGEGNGAGMLMYDFGHEKLRALVYEETSLARRRLLHRRVAEALLTRARAQRKIGPVASQIAQHYQLSGQDAEAAEYFRLAGEHARALYANAEALAHFRLALALGHPQAAVLHEAIGDLQTLAADYGTALTAYETAAAFCEPGALGRLEHKLGDVHHRRGEWDHAESHFRAALAAWGEIGFAGERARLYADWSLTAHRQGQTQQALDLAHRAMELAEQIGDAQALAQAHNILGILAASQGDLDRARRDLERSLALAETLGDPGARAAALNNLALACGAAGEIERAIQLAETALALCASQGDRHHEAALHNNLADLLHVVGKSDTAMSHLKQAVTILSEIGVQAGTVQPEIWKLAEW
jgi:tetratricopeptide (TPR) repeat protein